MKSLKRPFLSPAQHHKLLEISKKAGKIHLKSFRKFKPGWGGDKGLHEQVSQVDRDTEDYLKGTLLKLLPGSSFYGEEGGQTGDSDLLWVVDPLDGTTNYLSGLEHFVVSIALAWKGETQVAVVHKAFTGECYHATKGKGFYLDNKAIPPNKPLTLKRAVICTGTPFRSPDTADAFYGCARELVNTARDIRRTGACALDLSWTACGYFQGFWEADLMPYDTAAAVLFLKETGCKVTNFQGQPYDFMKHKGLVAALPGVHRELLAIVSKHYKNLRT